MAKTVTAPLGPWDRQPGENAKPFEAFVIYRDLGPGRSLPQVAEKLGKSATLIERWSAANDWVKRATAWDAEQDRIARQEQLDEIVKMRKRHAKIAEKALDKVSQALDMVDPEHLSNADISRLMETASKLERLSRGDVGDVIEERDGGEAINPVQIYIPDNHRGKEDDTFDDLKV